jgi:ketosteroid isomerase-like protein
MKRLAIVVCVVGLVFAVAAWAQTPPKPITESVKQELIKLENSWNDATVKRDVAFLDGILADDYTLTEFDGNIVTKAQLLANLKSGEQVTTFAVASGIKVRVYGDAAVVMGLNTEKGQNKGTDASGQYQWTDTWVKIAGHWRCVATHASKIAQK